MPWRPIGTSVVLASVNWRIMPSHDLQMQLEDLVARSQRMQLRPAGRVLERIVRAVVGAPSDDVLEVAALVVVLREERLHRRQRCRRESAARAWPTPAPAWAWQCRPWFPRPQRGRTAADNRPQAASARLSGHPAQAATVPAGHARATSRHRVRPRAGQRHRFSERCPKTTWPTRRPPAGARKSRCRGQAAAPRPGSAASPRPSGPPPRSTEAVGSSIAVTVTPSATAPHTCSLTDARLVEVRSARRSGCRPAGQPATLDGEPIRLRGIVNRWQERVEAHTSNAPNAR